MARHVGRLKLGSKPTQLYVRLSIKLLSQQTKHVSSVIIMHYVVAFVCLHLYLTGFKSGQFVRRALHYACGSRKFFRLSVQPPWGSVYIYIYIYIYIYNLYCALGGRENILDKSSLSKDQYYDIRIRISELY